MDSSRGFSFSVFTLAVASFGAGLSSGARAEVDRSLYRAPDALAMGEAVTAFIDDHNALWYNPAGAAAFDSVEWRMISIDIGATKDAYSSYSAIKKISSPKAADVNGLMGKDILAEASIQSELMLPQFGIAAIYDFQAGFLPQNQTFPHIQYGYQHTDGFQAAFGWSSKDGFKRRGRRSAGPQSEWRFGIGGKMMLRKGGFKELTVAQIFNLNKENALADFNDSGTGIGGDVGIQRIQRIDQKQTVSAGMSYLNVGDLGFGGHAAPVRGSVNAGVASQWDFGVPKLTLSADLHHLQENVDFREKVHVGVQLRIPIFTLSAGLNQMRPAYGIAADFWLLRVSALSYGEQLGPIYNGMPKQRYVARVEVKLAF